MTVIFSFPVMVFFRMGFDTVVLDGGLNLAELFTKFSISSNVSKVSLKTLILVLAAFPFTELTMLDPISLKTWSVLLIEAKVSLTVELELGHSGP